MFVAQAVPALVLARQFAEDMGPGVLDADAFVPSPHRRGADQLRGLVTGDIAHLFDADHRGEPVAAGFDLRPGCERSEAAGGAGALVAGGGDAGEPGKRCCQESTEVALIAEEFAREVADMGGVEVLRLEAGGREALLQHFAHTVGQLPPVARPVRREVGLVATEDIDAAAHGCDLRYPMRVA